MTHSKQIKRLHLTPIGQAGGGSWNRKNRPRVDTHPLQAKFKWELTAT